jgi:hypothetical protein
MPNVPEPAVGSVLEYITTTYQMKRPPLMAARVLAYICEFYGRDYRFPSRELLAKHLGSSKFTIDAVLQAYLSRGELTQRWEVLPSDELQGRDSVVRHRYYDPSEALMDAYRRGLKIMRRGPKLSVVAA